MGIDIRDHGGAFGGGIKPFPGSSKIFTQLQAPGVSPYQGYDPYISGCAETKNYYWYSYFTSGSTHILIRKSKTDMTDIKSATLPFFLDGIDGIYDVDQVVIVDSNDYVHVFNSLLVDVGGISLPYAQSFIALCYNQTTKIAYVITSRWDNDVYQNYTTMTAINLTTVSAITTVYIVTLIIGNGNTNANTLTVAFDTTALVVRVTEDGKTNKKFSLATGYLVSTHTLVPQVVGDTVLGVDFDTTIQINNVGITKLNWNTNAVILQKTTATLRTELAPYVKDSTLMLETTPVHYCGKTSNGNYLGLIVVRKISNAGSSYVLAFTFNESFQILKVETDFGFYSSVNRNGPKRISPPKPFTASTQSMYFI